MDEKYFKPPLDGFLVNFEKPDKSRGRRYVRKGKIYCMWVCRWCRQSPSPRSVNSRSFRWASPHQRHKILSISYDFWIFISQQNTTKQQFECSSLFYNIKNCMLSLICRIIAIGLHCWIENWESNIYLEHPIERKNRKKIMCICFCNFSNTTINAHSKSSIQITFLPLGRNLMGLYVHISKIVRVFRRTVEQILK